MGRKHIPLGVWVLAILTFFVIFGDHTAYASGDKPKVEAAGWYLSTNLGPGGGQPGANTLGNEIKIGLTGKCDVGPTCSGTPIGRFEYFDTVTGLRVHGKLDTITFHGNLCGNVPVSALAPAVTVMGHCDDKDGDSCSFSADLVDGGDHGPNNDWVCNLDVAGENKNHAPMTPEHEDAQTLTKGNIKIRNFQP